MSSPTKIEKLTLAITILVSLLAWTTKRLADNLTNSPVIEFSHHCADLNQCQIDIVNLSRSQKFENVNFLVKSREGANSTFSNVSLFAEPPAMQGGMDEPKVGTHSTIEFTIHILQPGDHYQLSYTMAPRDKITFHLAESKEALRLEESSIATFFAKHENGILLALVILISIFLFIFYLR